MLRTNDFSIYDARRHFRFDTPANDRIFLNFSADSVRLIIPDACVTADALCKWSDSPEGYV